MSEWQPISELPEDPEFRVLVYVPSAITQGLGEVVFEAKAHRDGSFYDPVYSEWSGSGATHFMRKPRPPKS